MSARRPKEATTKKGSTYTKYVQNKNKRCGYTMLTIGVMRTFLLAKCNFWDEFHLKYVMSMYDSMHLFTKIITQLQT